MIAGGSTEAVEQQPRATTTPADTETLAAQAGGRPAAPRLRHGDAVGRYLVLERIGSGGMGVVFAAYDPELDRKVALKLLTATPDASQGTTPLLGEAQALARLAHPNVVAVHDAGTLGECVWLAMELVHGETLRAWCARRPRSWRQVVAVAIAACRGLAAAHAVGLVHRDVKPENIMVDDDPAAPLAIGRVRVMDFGLAHARARTGDGPAVGDAAAGTDGGTSLAGEIAGTPAYMAPEQLAGLRADASSDQFSLCASIWECLYGQRPFAGDTLAALAANVLEGRIEIPARTHAVPSWLRATLRRGLATEANRRFPDTAALLAALQRGQTQQRRRRVAMVAAGVVLAAAAGFAARGVLRARRTADCEAEGATIAAVWNEQRRADTDAALRQVPLQYAGATAQRVLPWLDDYARSWQSARTEACLDAHVREQWSEALLDRSRWCLDDRRRGFEALLDELERADAEVVSRAVRAAAGLPTLTWCRDGDALARLPPPPAQQRDEVADVAAQLARADALSLASRVSEGLALASQARERADALAWPPLRAITRAIEADLLEIDAQYERAAEVGADAYFEAARIDAWDVAAATATQLALTVGERNRQRDEAMQWARHAQLSLAHAGATGGVDEARLLRVMAAVEFNAGDAAASIALGERALAMYQRLLGDEHPDVAYTLTNLANAHHAAGDYAGARALNLHALALLEATLGPDHPEVARACENLASALYDLGDYTQAGVVQRRALSIWEATVDEDNPALAFSRSNLGTIYDAAGDYAASLPLYERAATSLERRLGPDHPDLALVLNNLAASHRALGELARATEIYRRALAIAQKANGPDHPDVALALANLGDVATASGDTETALALLRRALAIRERTLGAEHQSVASTLGSLAEVATAQGDLDGALRLLERAVAIYDGIEGVQAREPEFRFALAVALQRRGSDDRRAARLAERARDDLREIGGDAVALGEMEQWLREHPAR
ncbi:MAG: serine/threonine-protein kinase [Nannocystaceae bacterium]|nr:serine/threonine-protein kinase [Nannocystaceae bacterium]